MHSRQLSWQTLHTPLLLYVFEGHVSLQVESGFNVRFAVVSHNVHVSAEPEHSLQLASHEEQEPESTKNPASHVVQVEPSVQTEQFTEQSTQVEPCSAVLEGQDCKQLEL